MIEIDFFSEDTEINITTKSGLDFTGKVLSEVKDRIMIVDKVGYCFTIYKDNIEYIGTFIDVPQQQPKPSDKSLTIEDLLRGPPESTEHLKKLFSDTYPDEVDVSLSNASQNQDIPGTIIGPKGNPISDSGSSEVTIMPLEMLAQVSNPHEGEHKYEVGFGAEMNVGDKSYDPED